jgi:hypothetical protein
LIREADMHAQYIGTPGSVHITLALGLAALLAVAMTVPAVAGTGEQDESIDPPYTRAEIKFLESNWVFGFGDDERSANDNPGNPWLTHEEIKFFEDNWVFGFGVDELSDRDNPKGTSTLTHPWGGGPLIPNY